MTTGTAGQPTNSHEGRSETTANVETDVPNSPTRPSTRQSTFPTTRLRDVVVRTASGVVATRDSSRGGTQSGQRCSSRSEVRCLAPSDLQGPRRPGRVHRRQPFEAHRGDRRDDCPQRTHGAESCSVCVRSDQLWLSLSQSHFIMWVSVCFDNNIHIIVIVGGRYPHRNPDSPIKCHHTNCLLHPLRRLQTADGVAGKPCFKSTGMEIQPPTFD